MIPRAIKGTIQESLKSYPIITLSGPRQSGKTTLLKQMFPQFAYFSMEPPDVRRGVMEDPRGFFEQHGHRLLIDEVQRVPELLSYIQSIVDEDSDAKFVLSGSQNMLMMEQVSQSLAGRTGVFYLLPFSLEELSEAGMEEESYEQIIQRGFYPRIFDKQLLPNRFYPDYLETYVQRDVRQIKNIGNLALFQRFLSICAGHIGQTINYAQLASDTGISVSSVQNWLSVLETSFVVYRLSPYFRNFNKRITKAPKLYFYDTGLACSLLRIRDADALQNYFQKGALFENFIINEISKYYLNQGARPPIYYWRDQKQKEVDLMIDLGGELTVVEIKSGRTFHPEFFKHLTWIESISSLPIKNKYVIYGGDQDWKMDIGHLLSWRRATEVCG
ncbi:MAG: ATP-binding protein [Bacteroidota bacterium]